MLTGELRGKTDAMWTAFWAGGITNPIERPIFPEGKDALGKSDGVTYADMRWSRLTNQDPATMFTIVADHVFSLLRGVARP